MDEALMKDQYPGDWEAEKEQERAEWEFEHVFLPQVRAEVGKDVDEFELEEMYWEQEYSVSRAIQEIKDRAEGEKWDAIAQKLEDEAWAALDAIGERAI